MAHGICYVHFEDKLAAENFAKKVKGTLWTSIEPYTGKEMYMVDYIIEIRKKGGD